MTWPKTVAAFVGSLMLIFGWMARVDRVVQVPGQVESLEAEVEALKDTFRAEARRADRQRALLYCELREIEVADCFRVWNGE